MISGESPPRPGRQVLSLSGVSYNGFSPRRPGRSREIIHTMAQEGIHVGLCQGIRFVTDTNRGRQMEWTQWIRLAKYVVPFLAIVWTTKKGQDPGG